MSKLMWRFMNLESRAAKAQRTKLENLQDFTTFVACVVGCLGGGGIWYGIINHERLLEQSHDMYGRHFGAPVVKVAIEEQDKVCGKIDDVGEDMKRRLERLKKQYKETRNPSRILEKLDEFRTALESVDVLEGNKRVSMGTEPNNQNNKQNEYEQYLTSNMLSRWNRLKIQNPQVPCDELERNIKSFRLNDRGS